MVTDPRKLRPSDLCRLLNSTTLGEVINERQLHRHRTRAGLRIGDARFVDLLRYVAWLIEVRHTPKAEPEGDPYEKLKVRARARNAAIALAGRDIGELPPVADPARKERAATDFRYFCEVYFPLTFHLPWSDDHLKVIARIEQAVLRGGLYSMATPRGFGKSSLCECACIWSVLYGHRDFVCLIGSDEGHACDMLDSIKMELDGNELLLEDFPEVLFPIQCLEGIANRCSGQLFNGERTHIGWTAKEVVLPTIPDSVASAAIIKVAGISEYKRRPGDRVGHNWRVPNVHGKRAVRHVVYDTNFWKTFIHARLAVAMGDRGCLSLFGDSPELHRLPSEHLSAEYRVKTEGRGRTVDEWKQRPERGDNHWFDCAVGCAVAASMQGVSLPGADSLAAKKQGRVSFAELQRRNRR